MQITGANDVDIMLDEDGQPVSDGNGDTALVSDDECWLQDIKNEAMTEEGELFYEDEEGDASYGWSCLTLCRESMMTSHRWKYSSVSVPRCPKGTILMPEAYRQR